MELSPANPSFLDMRNSILQADLVVNGGKKQTKIWKIFAGRGMGWFAGAVDGDDTTPVEDFSMPPAPNTPTGTPHRHGDATATPAPPIAGAVVAFGGHNSGFAGDYAAITDATGTLHDHRHLPGHLPEGVLARARVTTRSCTTVSVAVARQRAELGAAPGLGRRSAGGGSIVAFNAAGLHRLRLWAGRHDRPVAGHRLGQRRGADRHRATTPWSTRGSSTVQLPAPVDIAEISRSTRRTPVATAAAASRR